MENEQKLQTTAQWIEVCEADFFARLEDVANQICAMKDVRLLRLSGPTCSGKTTAANLLRDRFAVFGKQLHLISIDDFYYDKEVLHARTKSGRAEELDYDSAQTIDFDELERFVREIFSERESHCPIFSFTEGKRVGYRTVSSSDRDIFIFEGIQAVYPEFTGLLEHCGYASVSIYISPQRSIATQDATISPNELRLLRRIVRDYNFRGTSPQHTMALWDGVRRNEESSIFPYAANCQYHIDSTMPYELGILKPYLEKILPLVPKESTYWNAAEKILWQVREIEPIPSSMLSSRSLYREFV